MRRRQMFYSVFALRDGTIYAALPKHRRERRVGGGKANPDVDGICQWWLDQPGDLLPQEAQRIRTATIATCLNVRRIVREQVETRLSKIESAIAAMQHQLDRIEGMLACRQPNGQS